MTSIILQYSSSIILPYAKLIKCVILYFWSSSFFLYYPFACYCRLLITFANSLDPDQDRQPSGLIWVQTIWKCDGIVNFEKQSADDINDVKRIVPLRMFPSMHGFKTYHAAYSHPHEVRDIGWPSLNGNVPCRKIYKWRLRGIFVCWCWWFESQWTVFQSCGVL